MRYNTGQELHLWTNLPQLLVVLTVAVTHYSDFQHAAKQGRDMYLSKQT